MLRFILSENWFLSSVFTKDFKSALNLIGPKSVSKVKNVFVLERNKERLKQVLKNMTKTNNSKTTSRVTLK